VPAGQARDVAHGLALRHVLAEAGAGDGDGDGNGDGADRGGPPAVPPPVAEEARAALAGLGEDAAPASPSA
jgi:hypothetical protein